MQVVCGQFMIMVVCLHGDVCFYVDNVGCYAQWLACLLNTSPLPLCTVCSGASLRRCGCSWGVGLHSSLLRNP